MSQKCAVRDCINTSETAIMYDFPKSDEKLESAWIAFCDRGDYWIPSRNSQICSIHFIRSDYRVSSLWKQSRRPVLKSNACPTIKLARKPNILGCDVTGCQNNETNLSAGVFLYDFPTDEETRKKWVNFCGKPVHWQPNNWSRVCSEHFDSEAASSKGTRNSLPQTLKEKAYPTLKGPMQKSPTVDQPCTDMSSAKIPREEIFKEKAAGTTTSKNTSIQRSSSKVKARNRNEKKKLIKERLQSPPQMGERLNKSEESNRNHIKGGIYTRFHYRCAVRDCENNTAKPVRDIELFPFPLDKTLRQRWLNFCQRGAKWQPESGDYVCYKHFDHVHFIKNRAFKKLVLRKCAIPTISSDGSTFEISTHPIVFSSSVQSNNEHESSSTVVTDKSQPNSESPPLSCREQSENISRDTEIKLSGNDKPTAAARRTQSRSSSDKSANSRSMSGSHTEDITSRCTPENSSHVNSDLNDEHFYFPMSTDKNDSHENEKNKSEKVAWSSNSRGKTHRDPANKSKTSTNLNISGGLFFGDTERTEEPTGASPVLRKSEEIEKSLILQQQSNLFRKNARVSLRNIAKDANTNMEKEKHGSNTETTSVASKPKLQVHLRSRSNTPNATMEQQDSLDKLLAPRNVETSARKNTDEFEQTPNRHETNPTLHTQPETITSDASITIATASTTTEIPNPVLPPVSKEVVRPQIVSTPDEGGISKTLRQKTKRLSPSKVAESSKSMSAVGTDEPQMLSSAQEPPHANEKCFKAPGDVIRRSRSDNTDKVMGEPRNPLSSNSPCPGENTRGSKDSIGAVETDSQRSRRSRERSSSVERDQLALSLTNSAPFYIDDTRRECSQSPECILPEDEPRQLFFHRNKEHEKLTNILPNQTQSTKATSGSTKATPNPGWSTKSKSIQHNTSTEGRKWHEMNLQEPLTPSFKERQKMVAEILNHSSSKCEVAKVLVLSPVRNKEPSPQQNMDIEAELSDMQDGSFYVDEEQAQIFFDGSPPAFDDEPINIFETSVEFEVDDTTEYNNDEEPATPVQSGAQVSRSAARKEIKSPVRKEIKSPARKNMANRSREISAPTLKQLMHNTKSVATVKSRRNSAKTIRQTLQTKKRRRKPFGTKRKPRDDKRSTIRAPVERELSKTSTKSTSSIVARGALSNAISPVVEKIITRSTEASPEGKIKKPPKRARPVSPSDNVTSPNPGKKSPVKTVKSSHSLSKKARSLEDQERHASEDMDVDIKDEEYDGLKTISAVISQKEQSEGQLPSKTASGKKVTPEWQQCEVLNCTNNILNSAGIMSFHSFPLNPERRSQWIEFCRQPGGWTPQNFSRICGKHFRTEDYAKVRLFDSVKKVLKIDALPSIYVQPIENVDEDTPETFFSMFDSSPEENASDTALRSSERQTSPKKSSPNKKKVTVTKTAEKRKQQIYQDTDDSDDSSSYLGDNIKEEDSDSCSESIEKNARIRNPSPPPSPTSSSESSEHFSDETRRFQDKIEEQEQLIEKLTKANDANEEKLKAQAEEILDLNIQVNAGQEAKRRLCKTVDELETSMRKLREEKQTYQADAFRNHLATSQFGKILSQNQIDLLLQTKKKVVWTKAELKTAFSLRYFSKNLYFYNYLKEIYPLPKTTSIQKYAQLIDLHGGILMDVLEIMSIFGKTLSAKDRATVLTYDRMPVKAAVEYNPDHDEILGPCNQVYIVIARGLFSDWKQPVYVDFQKKVSAAVVKSIVENLHRISFEVVALANDCSEDKLKLFLDLGVSGKSPFFAHPNTNKKICCFFDSPRLLEKLRRTLVSVGFTFVDGTVLTKEPLRKLLQSGSYTAADGSLYSASNSILNLSASFTNSNLGVQLFSKTTVSLLRKSTERDDLVLAQFVECVYKWFQIMSSTNLESSAPLSVAYRGSSDQSTALNNAFDMIKSIRCMDTNRMKVFQEAILISIRALQLFSQEMFKSYGEKSILACKLNQQTIDLLFNQIRDDCDLAEDEIPTPLNLLDKMRAIVFGLSHEPIDLEPILFTITESYITRTIFEEAQVKPSIREKPFDQILFISPQSMNPEIIAKHIEDKCKLAKLIDYIKAKYRQKYADSDDDLPPKVKLTTVARGCASVQSSTSYADQMKNYCWLLEKIFRKTNKNSKFAYKSNVLETLADQARTKTHVHLDVIRSFLIQRILIRAIYMNMKLSEKS